jgi:hypothetical protein
MGCSIKTFEGVNMTTVDWQAWDDVLKELKESRLLKHKIKKYVSHTADCKYIWGGKECSCGLRELLGDEETV